MSSEILFLHCCNIATLCCTKNRLCEWSRVTSPLNVSILFPDAISVSVHLLVCVWWSYQAQCLRLRLCSQYTVQLFVRTRKLSGIVCTPIRLHFRDRPGAAPLQKTRAEITVLMCEQKPSPVWFLCRRKNYPAQCENRLNIHLNIIELKCYIVSMSIHY